MRCVCWLFIFKGTEPSPLQDSFSVRQQSGLPGPPPRNPSSRIHRRPRPAVDGTALMPGCVCWLFILKDTEPSPLQDSLSVRQQG